MSQRHGLTLLELVVSLASSIVLVAGLVGSLYIANQALDGSARARQSLTASTVLRDLMADVSEAKSIVEQTERAITFTVPDRNGDGAPETIRYEWLPDEPLKPLTYQYNGGALLNIATDVRAFNLSALTRELGPPSFTAPVATGVVFEGFKEKAAATASPVVIDKPDGTAEGDLLIACVVADGSATLMPPAGWMLLHSGFGRYGTVQVTLGVWRKIASSSEPGSYSWSTGKSAYGWVMRFTGHDSANPINASAITQGVSRSQTPECPPVLTTVPNALILRLGGFDRAYITIDSPGLAAPLPHVPITMDFSSQSSTGCSAGAGYAIQESAGNSSTSAFALTGAEEYVTVTIAIAPETVE